jgi:HSP20 family protein
MSDGIAKRDPFREFSSLRLEIDRLFDAFFGKTFSESSKDFLPYPPVVVQEAPDEFVVQIELPGVSKEDIHLTVTEDSLVVSGEKRMTDTGGDTTFHQIEVSYGQFDRSIPFAAEVAPERSKATFKDGVLTIRVPKSAKETSKAVDVEVK